MKIMRDPLELATAVAVMAGYEGQAALFLEDVCMAAVTRRVRSVSALADACRVSRRALARQFAAAGLPTPDHVLRLVRMLLVWGDLKDGHTLEAAAARRGYSAGSTVSNTMNFAFGFRPTVAMSRPLTELVATWQERV